MRTLYRITWALGWLGVAALGYAQPGDAAPTDDTDAAQTSAITINREAGTIDLNAKMVDQAPQWLELIATTPDPGGRSHEALVTIDAKPSRIHLALVTLGLEPGHPLRTRRDGEHLLTEPAAGPELQISFLYQVDGETREAPAHTWVLNEATGEPIPPCRWVFAGSTFKQWQGREYYMADENGTIISLVNFGDDLVVRQTDTTQDTDFQQLKINAQAIPPYGSDLILRIRVIPPGPEPADEPGAEVPPNGPEPADTSHNEAPAEP